MKLLVVLVLTVLLLAESSDIQRAYAGVLSRGNNQISVPRPRSHNRSVRSQTKVMRSTQPTLVFRGDTVADQYRRMARADRKYQQKLLRWERKKYRIEQKAKRREERLRRARDREREKLERAKLRKTRPHMNAVTGADPTVAQDPRAWFSQKIAGQKAERTESAPTGNKLIERDSDSKDGKPVEQKAGEPRQKSSFWTHIGRALGLS